MLTWRVKKATNPTTEGGHASLLLELAADQGGAAVSRARRAAEADLREALAERRRPGDEPHRRLQQLADEARARALLAEARVLELQARRGRLVLEAGRDLGRELVELDGQIGEARQDLAAAATEEGKLQSEAESARAAARERAQGLLREVRHELGKDLAAEREAVLAELAKAAAPHLERLLALEGKRLALAYASA